MKKQEVFLKLFEKSSKKVSKMLKNNVLIQFSADVSARNF